MSIWDALYVLSISLQISGATILSVYWCKNKDQIFQNEYYKQNSNSFLELKSGAREIETDSDIAFQSYKTIWTNRISFIYILLGFLTGVFGKQPAPKWEIVLLIVIVSLLLTVLSYILVKRMSKRDLKNTEYWNMLVQSGVPNNTLMFTPIEIKDPEKKK